MATVALVIERVAADRSVVNGQLQRALTSRIVLEQAKGVIANMGDLDMQDAFNVLRRYARDHGVKLTQIAEPGRHASCSATSCSTCQSRFHPSLMCRQVGDPPGSTEA